MKAILYTKEGKKKAEVVLNPQIFSTRVNTRLLELVQKAYSANLRHGTADTKTRKEVRGGGKKPWKQKGTGRARHGSTRSPIWKGGGVVFGPHPRSYYVNLSKSMRQQALISALSLKGEQKNIFLLEDVKLQTPKTKEWAEIIKALPLEGKRALCVVKEVEPAFERASRNLEKLVNIKRASDVNAYDVLRREKVVIEQDAIGVIEERLLAVSTARPETSLSSKEKPKKKTPTARRVKALKVGVPVKVRKMARAKKKKAQDKKRSKKK